nr:hypothetical protein [uncultured Neisseria sp.]
MFKNLKAPFQPSEESETGVFILTGIRAPYHKTNSQPFPIPELVFDGRATPELAFLEPEEIALLEKVRQTEEETGISHEN